MNNKQSPFILFTVLLGLVVAGFAFFLVFVSFGKFFYLLPIIIIIAMVVFFLYVANQLTSGALAQKTAMKKPCQQCSLQIPQDATFCPSCGAKQVEQVICDFCGHENPYEQFQCENCNALLK